MRYRPLHAGSCLIYTHRLLAGLLFMVSTALGQSRLSLQEGLQKLNQKRGLYFLYDPAVINGRSASVPTDWSLPTEPLLTQLLRGTQLSFRKVGDCYLIEAATAPAPPPPPVSRASQPTRRYTISGYVKEQNSGEQLAGAMVYVVGKVATTTNAYGYFALSLPASDDVELLVSLVGYQRVYERIRLDRNQSINILLPNNDQLDEVVLVADASERAGASPQTSQHSMPVATLNELPAVLGEKDVLKTLQLLPGVQKGLDGQAGLHVRGGGADQNLLILDDAPVYNANHLFGFFSVFNVDALKNTTMQKGGFSARYGGRLSSVVDMTMRDGNRQTHHGEIGTGLVTSRLLLEGPLIKNKASFLLTARRTNFPSALGNFVVGLLDNFTGTDWKANFYDLNMKVNADLDRRNQLYLSSYFGRDFFGGGDSLDQNRRWENGIRWGNATGTLRWNHLFSERLFSNLSLIYSNYYFSSHTRFIPTSPDGVAQTWRSFDGLTDYSAKYDLDYFPRLHHQIRAGVILTRRTFRLNGYELLNAITPGQQTSVEHNQSQETSVYAEDEWTTNNRLTLKAGGRVTRYRVQGQSFFRAEPRLSITVRLTDKTALRSSYAEMNQFVHQLTNTGQGLPTDLWVPATDRVRPQQARQFVLAAVHDLTPKWQLSLEVYQKQMQHIIGYHPNADFIGITNTQDAANIQWERNVTTGNGSASGVELMLQRKVGRLSGWLAYTWAITRWRFDELNNGQPFYPNHDRRHTLSWVGTYAIRSTLKLSANWMFSSGNPQSLPVSGIPSFGHLGLGKPNDLNTPSEQLFGTEGPLVQVRRSFNTFRAEPFHRLDLTLQKSYVARRLTHQVELGIVNAYGRRNPLYYDLHLEENNQLTLKRISLFTFIPSVNYTLRF
ncbi:TonB-dependent receptor [Spirosoma sp. 209]|uniref:TonB-dependent receptor n=1 Tax=Spirosoma sp. 209 TaxID=1955701 RepID=UPI00098D2171|nr:TonB-dependent receptor [Spirosoma sp. 209]